MEASDRNLSGDPVPPGDQQTERPDQPDPSSGASEQPPRENPPGDPPDSVFSNASSQPSDDQAPDDSDDDADLGLRYDDGGNLIDPPSIPEYERRLTEAATAGDQDQIDLITEEYRDKQVELARRRARREREES